MLKPIFIETTTLADAWFQTVYKCIEVGREFIIDEGSYNGDKRLEFDYITIHITNPGCPYNRTSEADLLPKLPPQYNLPNPVEDQYLFDYIPYLMTCEKKANEQYTYGERLCAGDIIDQDGFTYGDLNQIETIINRYKVHGFRNNQLVLQIAQPGDLTLNDPPCLRHIDTRIQDNKLHFFPYFRSWDLWGGFPANLAAIQILKEYMAVEIGVEDGEIIASSKGLHLYKYVWQLAEVIRGRTIDEFRGEHNISC
jgi:thymidylate synthase